MVLFRMFPRLARVQDRIGRILGINGRNLAYIYPFNPRRFFPFADDKLRTKELLVNAGVPVPATLAVVRGFFEVPAVARRFKDRTDYVIKPARGRGGGGVLVVGHPAGERGELTRELETGEAAIRKHLGDILFGVYSFRGWDIALVEERLRPHPGFPALCGNFISDVRVILHETRPILAMLRVPTVESGGCSNLHRGALGLGIDMERGVTCEGYRRGELLRTHPESGVKLEGIPIPEWKKVLQVSIRAAEALPLGYLGMDICLDGRRGPVVLEANVRPGLEIQNANRIGLRALLEEAAR